MEKVIGSISHLNLASNTFHVSRQNYLNFERIKWFISGNNLLLYFRFGLRQRRQRQRQGGFLYNEKQSRTKALCAATTFLAFLIGTKDNHVGCMI